MTLLREAPAIPGPRVTRRASRVLSSGPVRPVELAVTAAGLAVLAAAVFGSHVLHGSFTYDDWANSARTHLAGGYGAALDSFWDLTGYRPVLAFYTPTLHALLGERAALHLAWAVLAAVLMSLALFAVLVEMRLARLHSFVVAGLVLVFPFSDSNRFWAQAATANVTGALWLAGLLSALRALDRRRSRAQSLRWHCASLLLYLTSLLLYELPATLMLAGGVLYLVRAGMKRGAVRWGVDVLVVGAALAYVLGSTSITTAGGTGGAFDHAQLILDQGWDVIAMAAWPFSAVPRGIVTLIAFVLVGLGTVVAIRQAGRDPASEELGKWLLLFGSGVAVTWTAWAVFIPSHPYYSPGSLGVGNRVNSLAAIGIALSLYAVLGVAVTLLLLIPRRLDLTAPIVAVVALAVPGAGYVERVLDDATVWRAAAQAQAKTLDVLRVELPVPKPSSVIWIFGQSMWQAPGIPVFAATWDLTGAVQLLYDDPSLRGYTTHESTTFDCGGAGVSPQGAQADPAAAYGAVYFIDISSGVVDLITDAEDCDSATARFQPGPT